MRVLLSAIEGNRFSREQPTAVLLRVSLTVFAYADYGSTRVRGLDYGDNSNSNSSGSGEKKESQAEIAELVCLRACAVSN